MRKSICWLSADLRSQPLRCMIWRLKTGSPDRIQYIGQIFQYWNAKSDSSTTFVPMSSKINVISVIVISEVRKMINACINNLKDVLIFMTKIYFRWSVRMQKDFILIESNIYTQIPDQNCPHFARRLLSAFSWTTSFVSRLEFHWSLFLMVSKGFS